jgi:hypothetical protein
MAEEIITSPEESISMEAPIAESPVEVQEDVVDVQPTPSKGLQNLQKLHSLLIENDVYSKITPERFDDFVEKYRDPIKMKKLHSLLIENDVYSQIMPADLNEAADKYGFGGLGKPSAVPSASVDGGSATKGRGVAQPSTLQPRSSEASLDNIERTMKVYADGQGAFPETLSAADVKELRKQVPGGELPNVSDEKVAKMLAGKSPKQVRIASVNAIPDIKERKTEQARMYLDFSREKSAENQQLDQNITALTQGLEQIKAEGENLQQQLQNPNIDPQTASMLNEQLQQTQANYNQAANDYNKELEKYQQNARFIKTMGAGGLSNLKGLVPSSMFQPRSPSDVMAASAFNSTAPALLKTLGAVVDIFPSMVYGEDAKDSNSPVADALFNIADKITIDIGKYNPQANVSLMDDVNAANASQLFGSLLGSVAMTFGGGAVGGATGSQVAGFSQVYGDVYKQGRDAGLTQAESMYFALPTGLVAAYFGDKGVESLAGVFSKTSIKSAIKQGMKEMAEKKTPQMMMEFGQQVLTNTLKGSVKEGLQEGSEFVTEFGSKKLASLKEDVKFKDDLSLEGFGKGLAESVIAGAAGGGLLGPFFGAGRNKAFADVVNKAARDPQAEVDFMNQLDASVGANDITPEQKQQMVEMLEKTKQAAATVPPIVESEPARTEATELVLEQQDLQEQIEQTNPAMAKPLNDRLDEINARLGEIAEGKNLPQEPTEEAQPTVEAAPVVDVLKDVQSTREALTIKIIQEISDASGILFPLSDDAPQIISERYHKAKADGSNPELVNAVESVLAPQPTPTAAAPQTLPEVENAISNLREQEQAENEETYNKYDEAITPLLEKEKELKAQAPVAEEAKGESGAEGDGFKQAGEKARDTKDATHIGRWMLDNSQKGDVVRFQDGGYEVTEVTTKKDGTKELVLTPFEFNEDGSKDYNNTGVKIITEQSIKNGSNLFENAYTNSKGERVIEQSTYEPVAQSLKQSPTSEQAPESFPAQEGATAEQEQEFKANPELEQIYRDLQAAVNKNIDEQTLRILKANPSEAMIKKAFDILQSKGVIKIDCN